MHFTISLKTISVLTFAFASVLHANEQSNIPTTEPELRVFLGDLAAKRIDIAKIQGTYALPIKCFIFGEDDIRYMEFKSSRMLLKKNKNDEDGFVFIYQPSLDNIVTASTLGELMTLFQLPEGGNYWKILSEVFLGVLNPDKTLPFAAEVPVKVCFFANKRLYFYAASFPVKMSEHREKNADKKIGVNGGPSWMKMESFLTF